MRRNAATLFVGILTMCFCTEAFADQAVISPVANVPHSHNSHMLTGDGKRVFFASLGDPVGQNPDGNMEVFVYEIDSGQIFQITDTQTQHPGWWNHNTIRTNFDGSRIVFRSTFALDTDKSYLNQYDIFVADLTYTASGPTAVFRRVTQTDERLAMALTGDGTQLFFASRHNLTGENPEEDIELFRVNLDPTPHFTQITHAPNGIVQGPGSQLQISMDTDYGGSYVVFTGNGNIVGNNSDGNFEIFNVSTWAGFVLQLTDTLLPVQNTDPVVEVVSNFPLIMFSSNGNMTGENPDGNREIFMRRIVNLYQLTNTTGGDIAFGGSNGHVSMDGTGAKFALSSTRDLASGSGQGFNNADGNREIFLGEWQIQGGALSVQFQQITDTSTSSPGSYFQNGHPRLSSLGNVIAFTSDLDLGFPGTNNIYIAKFPGIDSGALQISNFRPRRGGPGVSVAISGSGFASLNKVSVGGVDATSFNILSDTTVVSTVPPGAVTGPITVSTPNGSATSTMAFELANLITFGMEFNQGIADYAPVSGKDALIRVFTGVDQAASGPLSSAWHISDATLEVTPPSGAANAFQLPASLYSQDVRNDGQQFSEKNNVNFYVPGALLADVGTYTFRAVIRTEGTSVFDGSINRSLVKTKDVVLFFRSVLRHPNQEEWKEILRGLELFSRIYPIRAGVGDLEGAIGASDFETGLRVAYLAAPIWEDDPRIVGEDMAIVSLSGCYAEINEAVEDALCAINSGGFELTEFGIAFIPGDKIPGPGGPVGCPIIDCVTMEQTGNLVDDEGNVHFAKGLAGEMTAWVLLCPSAGVVFNHETGHLLGLVPPSAPNHSSGGHSKGKITEPAFNLRIRKHIQFPVSLMAGGNEDVERNFLENSFEGQPVDYPWLVSQRLLEGSLASGLTPGSSLVGMREERSRFLKQPLRAWPVSLKETYARRTQASQRPSWTFFDAQGGNRFTLMATLVTPENVTVRHSFVSKGPGVVSRLDSASPYSLVFFDPTGRVLATDPIRFRSPVAPGHKRGYRNGDGPPHLLTSIRPLPPGTVAVEIRRDGVPLRRIQPGAVRPKVSTPQAVIIKGSGQTVLRVRWDARDPDRDPLSYHVEFSRDDGKTFFLLVPSMRKTQVAFDIRGLPGGDRLRIRVTASDGLNTSSAISRPFSLPQHAPYAAITSLTNGARYHDHDSIPLRGLAYDMEEGILGDRRIDRGKFRWFLDSKKYLGGGVQRFLQRNIKPGKHKVTLKVTDSSGKVGTDSVLIFIDADSDEDGRTDAFEIATPGFDPYDPYDGWNGKLTRRGPRSAALIYVLLGGLALGIAYIVWRLRIFSRVSG